MGVTIDGPNNQVKVNDVAVVGAQAAAEADAAAAMAAAAAITGAVVGDTVSTTGGWGSSTEAGFDSMHVAIDANVADIAAQKVELDKLITDHAAVLATLNALLAKLRTHGLIDT